MYDAVRALQPDTQRGTAVDGLVVSRDVGTFELANGELQLLQPIEGRTVGAVWVGEGRFTLTPPTDVERSHVRRLLESDGVDVAIRRVVFLFPDGEASTFPEVNWVPRQPIRGADDAIEDAIDYLSNDEGWIDRDVALALLGGEGGYFRAHIVPQRGDRMVYQVNPLGAEEVSLARSTRGQWEIITQFHRQEDYERGRSSPQEALDLIQVPQYEIDATVEDDLDFTAHAALTVTRLRPDHAWIPFTLYEELEVDSVRWSDGSAAAFERPGDASVVWVDFGGAPTATPTVTISYHGDLLDQPRNLWVEMKSTTGWLPVYEFGRPASYRLTFHHPSRLTVAAVGAKVAETGPGPDGMVTSTWQTPTIWQATFNVGRFVEQDASDPRFPDLVVQYDQSAHDRLSQNISDMNYLTGRACFANCRFLPRQQEDMAERVAEDLRASLAFFQDVYGPTPIGTFTASEIPSSHGEAWAGLVLLAWSTFGWTAEQGYDEMFRAHEVAHQWWGIGVRPATYRDRWLAEGFAEFSGLWYTARVRGSIDILTRRLKETREELMQRRDEAAPISLGTRAGTASDPGDYSLVVYEKGAWVLHMLRVLLTDQETGSDDRFEAMIKDFYTTYYGRNATTQQFMAVVEKHAGIPMDWFFEEWVDGSAIPRYTFSHVVEPLPDGQYRVRVRVRQDRVPEGFQMIVPIFLDFGLGGYAYVNILVEGSETVTELPLLPAEPEEVVFNPFESVLAEVRTERWRD